VWYESVREDGDNKTGMMATRSFAGTVLRMSLLVIYKYAGDAME